MYMTMFNSSAVCFICIILVEYVLPREFNFIHENRKNFLLLIKINYSSMILYGICTFFKAFTAIEYFRLCVCIFSIPFFMFCLFNISFQQKIQKTINSSKTKNIATKKFRSFTIQTIGLIFSFGIMLTLPFWLPKLTWYTPLLLIIHNLGVKLGTTLLCITFLIKLSYAIKTQKIQPQEQK